MRELQIKVELTGDDEAKRGLADVDRAVDKVASTATKTDTAIKQTFGVNLKAALGVAAGAFAAAGIDQKLDQYTAKASAYADAIQTAGAKSATVFQQIVFAAKQGGSSLDGVVAAMVRMNDGLGSQSKPALAALDRLGLTFAQIKALAPEQQFIAIGNAVRQIKDPNDAIAIMNDLFGRGGSQLLPAFRDGLLEVGRAAPVMSDALIQSGDKAGDRLDALKERMDNLQYSALAPLMGAFLALPDGMQTALAGVSAFLPSLETLTLGILAAGGPTAALAALQTGAAAVGTFFLTTLPSMFGAVIAFLGPQGLLALGALALYGIWKIWGDDITRVVANLYAAIKDYLGNKLSAIFDDVKGKVDAVTGFFRDMYDKVVGHSYVPDMVTGIGTEFGKLQSLMVTPAIAAADQVTRVMQSMYDKVKAIPTHQLFDVIPESLRDDPRVMLQGAKDQDRLRALAMGLGAPSVAAHGAPGPLQGGGMGDAFSGAFSTIGPSILKAIQGGGNVLQSAGSAFGLSVTKQLFDEGSPASNLIGKGVSKLFGTSGLGKMITESIGSFLPGVGALVGPLVGKLGGLIKGMFGPDAKELEGRQGAGDFKTQIQSQLTELQKIEVAHANVTGAMQQQVALHIKIRDAVIATGVDQETATQRATAMVDQLWRAEKNGGAAVKTVIEQINGVIESGTTSAIRATGDEATAALQQVGNAAAMTLDQVQGRFQSALSKIGISGFVGGGGGGQNTGDNSSDQQFSIAGMLGFAQANGINDIGRLAAGGVLNNAAEDAKAQNWAKNFINDHAGWVESEQANKRNNDNQGNWQNQINALEDAWTQRQTGMAALTMSTGGLVPQYLAGGGRALSRWARGTDTVPAMLTPGEFVMNAQATQRNLGTLQSMNRGGGGGVSISIGSIAVDSGMTEAEFGRKAVAALTGEMRRRGVKFA